MATVTKIRLGAHNKQGEYEVICWQVDGESWTGMVLDHEGNEAQQVQHSFVAALERHGVHATLGRIPIEGWVFHFRLKNFSTYRSLVAAHQQKVGSRARIYRVGFTVAVTNDATLLFVEKSPGQYIWASGGPKRPLIPMVAAAVHTSELCTSAAFSIGDLPDGLSFTLKVSADPFRQLEAVAEVIHSSMLEH